MNNKLAAAVIAGAVALAGFTVFKTYDWYQHKRVDLSNDVVSTSICNARAEAAYEIFRLRDAGTAKSAVYNVIDDMPNSGNDKYMLKQYTDEAYTVSRDMSAQQAYYVIKKVCSRAL